MKLQKLLFKEFVSSNENPYANFLGAPGDLEYFTAQTLNYYSLQIQDALLDALTRVTQLSSVVREKSARDFLLFGAGRRLNMLWYSYRALIGTVHPGRSEPLSDEEGRDLTRDINVIYMNITGALDNFCLALLHEYAPENLNLSPHKLGLFQEVVTADDRFIFLREILLIHSEWDRDVKKRRNPSAHRIPPYVPSQVVTKEEAEQYSKLMNGYWGKVAGKDFDAAEQILRQTEKIGRFTPIFMHDPSKGAFPIYPTAPDDIGHLLTVFAGVEAFIRARALT